MILDVYPKSRLTAVEWAPSAVKRLRAHLRGLSARVVSGDIRNVIERFDNGSFGLVFCNETIYYLGQQCSLPDLDHFFRTLSDKIAPDGVLEMSSLVRVAKGDEVEIVDPFFQSVYLRIVRRYFDMRVRARFVEKDSDGLSNEYEICAFKSPPERNGSGFVPAKRGRN
jgi:SAM-dependent methyltransferase